MNYLGNAANANEANQAVIVDQPVDVNAPIVNAAGDNDLVQPLGANNNNANDQDDNLPADQ